jgi:thimet oligopeptidase
MGEYTMHTLNFELCLSKRLGTALALFGLLVGRGAHAEPLHVWSEAPTVPATTAWTEAHLARERQLIDKLVDPATPRTVEGTFALFDAAVAELDIAGAQVSLMKNAHADRAIRDAAQGLVQKVSEAEHALGLNPDVYRAIVAIDLKDADPPTRHAIERTLLEYRLAGADRDEPTRKQLRELLDAATARGLEFDRNIRESVLTVDAAGPGELAGLPADFIAAHAPDKDGHVRLTTDFPDYSAVMNFARDADLRHRMYVAYQNRAYPQNEKTLHELLVLRRKIANLLGYPGWPDMSLTNKMMATTARLNAFIDSVDQATRATAQREYGQLLAFAREDQPSLESISIADRLYWFGAYSRKHYAFDAQEVRPYFPYAQVEKGILAATGRLFRVRFEAAKDAAVWDPAVSAWDVYDEDAASPRVNQRIGRIYLDMHPREGKDKWFNSSTLVPGIAGRQLPEGRLLCNFPGGKTGEPGLMLFSDVVTFFHELGHLMHGILGGQVRWASISGVATERDFVEAPSQMLEEFFHDPALLQSFARHYQSGEVLPAATIERMNRADAFGRAIVWRRQLSLSALSYGIYAADPSTVDFAQVDRDTTVRYMPLSPVDGLHACDSFGHLVGYSSNYYTYVIDKVIAEDLFHHFDRTKLVDGPAALKYRHAVLEPGGSKPANELIADFLGRPYDFKAFQEWLGEEFRAPAAAK